MMIVATFTIFYNFLPMRLTTFRSKTRRKITFLYFTFALDHYRKILTSLEYYYHN